MPGWRLDDSRADALMLLEIDSVSFSYSDKNRGDTHVLDRFDLRVESESVHAIVGPSGCGKSTLLRLVAGLERPTRGEVRFVGPRRHAQDRALVFQDPTLIPWWTVGRNLGIGIEFDTTRSSIYSKVRDFTAQRVGLGGLADRLPGTLSRGQQTRVGIGRALAYDADVMLLDEPFTHLDAVAARRLREEFETHWQLDPRTYVLVTHDIEEAVLLADRVSVMSLAPAHVVETIEVDVGRPRTVDALTEPGSRAAIARIWDVLDRASQ